MQTNKKANNKANTKTTNKANNKTRNVKLKATDKKPDTKKADKPLISHDFTITKANGGFFSSPLKTGKSVANGQPSRPRALSARDSSLLAGCKAQYNNEPFTTRGLDNDIINNAVYRGELTLNEANQTVQFTTDGLTTGYALAASNGGFIVSNCKQ